MNTFTTAAMPKHRESNLELFRILLMLAIIAHHYVVNSGLVGILMKNPDAPQTLPLWLFGAWGKTGINSFLLITGYFMCTSKISAEKFCRLLFEWLFYLTVIAGVFFLFKVQPLTVKNLIMVYKPGSFSFSFTFCFLIFYLLIPFLNLLIEKMNQKMYLRILLLLLFYYTLLPSLKMSVSFNYVTWFSVIYLIAAYIRLYPSHLFEGALRWGFISVIMLCCASLSIYICWKFYRSAYFFLTDCNKIMALGVSVSLFFFFKNMHLSYYPWINWVAQSIFGVLLIHANSNTMRQWLWMDTLKNAQMFYSPKLWLHAFCSVVGIFLVCTVIDHLRIFFLEKPFFKKYGKRIDSFSQKIFPSVGLDVLSNKASRCTDLLTDVYKFSPGKSGKDHTKEC